MLLNHHITRRAISLPTLTYVREGLGQTVNIWENVWTFRRFPRRIHSAECVLLPKSSLNVPYRGRSEGETPWSALSGQGGLTMTRNVEEKGEDEDGDQSQKQVGEKAAFLRGPLLVAGSTLDARAQGDLVLVFEIPG